MKTDLRRLSPMTRICEEDIYFERKHKMEHCKNCIWAEQCPTYIENCSDYSPLDGDMDDLVAYALDLLARSNTYNELIDEMEGNA
jgi:hypothetical protein